MGRPSPPQTPPLVPRPDSPKPASIDAATVRLCQCSIMPRLYGVYFFHVPCLCIYPAYPRCVRALQLGYILSTTCHLPVRCRTLLLPGPRALWLSVDALNKARGLINMSFGETERRSKSACAPKATRPPHGASLLSQRLPDTSSGAASASFVQDVSFHPPFLPE